jgi:hypothetical protein
MNSLLVFVTSCQGTLPYDYGGICDMAFWNFGAEASPEVLRLQTRTPPA